MDKTSRGYKIPDPNDLEQGHKDLTDNFVKLDEELNKVDDEFDKVREDIKENSIPANEMLRRLRLNSLLGESILPIRGK